MNFCCQCKKLKESIKKIKKSSKVGFDSYSDILKHAISFLIKNDKMILRNNDIGKEYINEGAWNQETYAAQAHKHTVFIQ